MPGTGTIGWTFVDFDADAKAFFTAASITDQTTKDAVNILVIKLKNNGLWSLAEAIYPIVGGNAAAHSVNLKNPGTFDLTFAGGWTHASTGMTPNGTTGYADTGYNCNTQHSDGLMSIGLYSRTDQLGTICDMGASNTAENEQVAIWTRFGDTFYGLAACTTISSNTANTDSRGWFFASRQTSTNNFLQKITTQINFSNAMGVPSFNVYIGARNRNGAAEFFSNKEFAFGWLSATLIQAQARDVYTIVQEFQTNLSRNV